MSQFAFLSAEFPDIFTDAFKAESLALSDPRLSCFCARRALELAVSWLYDHDGTLRDPYESTLAARLHEPTFRNLVGPTIVAKARIIKDTGNAAVHEARAVKPEQAVASLRELFHVAYWLSRTYARGAKPPANAVFSPQSLPRTTQVAASTLRQLQEAAKKADESAKALEDAKLRQLADETQRSALEAQIKALQAEFAAAKAANAKVPDTHDYDEAATRDTFIDMLLREADWPLDKPEDREYPVTARASERYGVLS